MARHEHFMQMALAEAALAREEGEVPVGAVIVHEGEVIAKAHNRREALQSPLSHAEIEVIRIASKALGRWRLDRCTLYVTLEPCIMCTGALLQARLPRLVFGCRDDKAGAVRSLFALTEDPRLNHRIEVIEGVLNNEAKQLIRAFFQSLRSRRVDSL